MKEDLLNQRKNCIKKLKAKGKILQVKKVNFIQIDKKKKRQLLVLPVILKINNYNINILYFKVMLKLLCKNN